MMKYGIAKTLIIAWISLSAGFGVLAQQIENTTAGTMHSTLSEAVAYASSGDIINMPNGTYTLSGTLNIDKALYLGGESEAGVIIDASGNGTGYGISIAADNVTLKNFTLIPPVVPDSLGSSAGGGYAIHASFNQGLKGNLPHFDLTMGYITIENGNRTAFDIHGYNRVSLRNLTANGAAYGNGIQLTACYDVELTGCSATGNAWGGLAFYCSRSDNLNTPCNNISYDMAANSIDAVYVEDQFGLVNKVSVNNATYQIDNDYSATGAMHFYTSADAATAGLIADGLNAKYGNTLSSVVNEETGHQVVTGSFSLIETVAAAASGDTIEVAAGTYTEAGQVVIDKNLTIIGEGSDQVTLLPEYTSGGDSYAPENGWIAVAEGVQFNLSGVTIDGEGQSIKMAIISRGTVRIDGCVIQNFSSAQYLGWGVCVLNGTDSVISNSEFYGIQRIGVHIRGAVVADTPAAVVENCLFLGKGEGDWVEYGVEFGGGGSGEVVGCTMSNFLGVASSDGSTSAGILATDYYGNGTEATVISNTIFGNTSAIMVGYADDDATILGAHHNVIIDNGTAVSSTPEADVDATRNYFGSDVADFSQLAGEPVVYSPLWRDESMTQLAFLDLYVDDDFTVENSTNFTTIQGAVATALPGSVIHVAEGSYSALSTLNIYKPLSIIGAGSSEVTFDLSGFGSTYGMDIQVDNVTVEGISILPPPGEAASGYAVKASYRVDNSEQISNLTLRDIVVDGGYKTPFDLHGVNGGLLDSLSAQNTVSGNGISLTGCSNITVTNCNTDGNAWGGIALYASSYIESGCVGIAVDSSNTLGESPAVYAQVGSYPLTDVSIGLSNYYVAAAANDLYYVNDRAAALGVADGYAAYSIPTVITAPDGSTVPVNGTLQVDDDFNSATPGWGYYAFDSLQFAIDAALPGETIEVAEGTYAEEGQLLINKDLRIAGAGADQVLLLPKYTSGGAGYAPENGWVAVAEGVKFSLSGVTIDGEGQTIKMAIISRGTVMIDGCVIQNIASGKYLGWGVCVLNGTESVISNSEFYGIQRIGVHIRGGVVADTPAALVENCLFVGKGEGDWVEYGVEFGGGGSGEVVGCTMSNFLGVAASDGSTSAGILATDYYGNGTEATVVSNTISGNTSGIMVGYADDDATILDAHYNVIIDNGTAVSSTPEADVDASQNWWGSAGISAVMGGVDSVVRVDSWYGDAAMTSLVTADSVMQTVAEMIAADPALMSQYGLYTQSSIQEGQPGLPMIEVDQASDTVTLKFRFEETGDLTVPESWAAQEPNSMMWNDIDQTVDLEFDSASDRAFYRLHLR